MLKSIKSWINLPIQIKPYVSRSGSGTVVYGTPVDALCYAEGKVEVIRNNKGIEVVSNSRLYLDGSAVISELDEVVFEGKEHGIQAITTFYRNGKPDLKVVYL